MKIGKAHPLLLGKGSKVWMPFSTESSGRLRKALDQVTKFLHVPGKFCGTSPATVLVDFGHGPEPMRPRDRRPKSNPFQEQARSRDGSALGGPIAHVKPKSIGKMANHVVGGHAAPATLACWMYELEPAQDFGSVRRIAKSFHIGGFPRMERRGARQPGQLWRS